MNLTRILFILCVFGGTILTASGFARVAAWGWTLITVAFSGLWLTVSGRNLHGRANAFGALFVFGCAACYFGWGLDPGLALIAILLGLSAWDLDHFIERMTSIAGFEGAFGIEMEHLKRMVFVNGVGLIVGGLALTVTLRLTFGWAVLMSVFVVFGLGQVIRHLRWGN